MLKTLSSAHPVQIAHRHPVRWHDGATKPGQCGAGFCASMLAAIKCIHRRPFELFGFLCNERSNRTQTQEPLKKCLRRGGPGCEQACEIRGKRAHKVTRKLAQNVRSLRALVNQSCAHVCPVSHMLAHIQVHPDASISSRALAFAYDLIFHCTRNQIIQTVGDVCT